MTENISYRKCTCDICGKIENVSISGSLLPKDWEHFAIGKKEYDVCLDCFVKVDMAIEDLQAITMYPTNGDKVRSMTNEELAHLLAYGIPWDDICKECEHFEECVDNSFCESKALAWLEEIMK